MYLAYINVLVLNMILIYRMIVKASRMIFKASIFFYHIANYLQALFEDYNFFFILLIALIKQYSITYYFFKLEKLTKLVKNLYKKGKI